MEKTPKFPRVIDQEDMELLLKELRLSGWDGYYPERSDGVGSLVLYDDDYMVEYTEHTDGAWVLVWSG